MAPLDIGFQPEISAVSAKRYFHTFFVTSPAKAGLAYWIPAFAGNDSFTWGSVRPFSFLSDNLYLAVVCSARGADPVGQPHRAALGGQDERDLVSSFQLAALLESRLAGQCFLLD